LNRAAQRLGVEQLSQLQVVQLNARVSEELVVARGWNELHSVARRIGNVDVLLPLGGVILAPTADLAAGSLELDHQALDTVFGDAISLVLASVRQSSRVQAFKQHQPLILAFVAKRCFSPLWGAAQQSR